MKKVTVFAFLAALALGTAAQASSVGPDARNNNVGPTAHPRPIATNSTINVPPVAKPSPVAVPGKNRR